MRLLDFKKPFEVNTDASNKATGGVLSQKGHPIASESRKLKDAKQQYTAHEKGMIAVVHCFQAWRHDLLGSKFVIRTDNVMNTCFKTQRKLTPEAGLVAGILGGVRMHVGAQAGKHN